MKRLIVIFPLLTAALLAVEQTAVAQQAVDPNRTHIFFSAGCADCWPYTEDNLIPALLVGLFTFPCSGGIYVSIITLLNAKTTMAWGVTYLALYNVLFVLPLMVILLVVGNRMAAKAWVRWERDHALKIRLWYGGIMAALGVAMLLYVIV